MRARDWIIEGDCLVKHIYPEGLIIVSKTFCKAEIGGYIVMTSSNGFNILPPPKNAEKPDAQALLAMSSELKVILKMLRRIYNVLEG